MKPNSTLSTLLGLAFLAAFGYALWYLARWGLGFWDAAGPTVQIGAAAALTLIVCASIIANGLHAVARREEAGRQRAIRAEVYEDVLRLRGARGGAGLLGGDEHAAEQRMLLHAPPAVLRAYLRLRRAQEGGGAGPAQDQMGDLARAMRRDLEQRAPDVGDDELAELLAPAGRPRVRLGTSDVMHG